MYVLCKAMDWKHLPVDGGIYAQHPDFLDKMIYVMQEEGKEEKRQEAMKKRSGGGGLGKPSRSSSRRR